MAKPVVDGLERRMGTKLEVAHVDIGTDEGRAIADRFHVPGIPAFIVLDGQGSVIYRQIGGRPNTAEIEAKVAALSAGKP